MMVTQDRQKYVCPECRDSIPIVDIEGIFQDELESYLNERKESVAYGISGDAELLDQRHSLSDRFREIRKTETEIFRNHHLYLQGEISTERFGQIHQPLENRLADLKAEVSQIEREIRRLESESDVPLEVDIDAMIKGWPNLPVKNRREVAQILIDRITIGNGDVEFSYRISQYPAPTNLPPTPPNKSNSDGHPSPSPKEASKTQHTNRPTNQIPPTTTDGPVFIRLPKSGDLCPRTGLTRSMLNELVLPTKRNGYNPPVKSKSLRGQGKTRGVRLILWESLRAYLERSEE